MVSTWRFVRNELLYQNINCKYLFYFERQFGRVHKALHLLIKLYKQVLFESERRRTVIGINDTPA